MAVVQMHTTPSCSTYRENIEKSFTIHSAMFILCTLSSGSGAAIYVTDYASVDARLCSFLKCTSPSYGGGIYLVYKSSSENSHFVGKQLYFQKCYARYYPAFGVESISSSQTPGANCECIVCNQNRFSDSNTFHFYGGATEVLSFNSTYNTPTKASGTNSALATLISKPSSFRFFDARHNTGNRPLGFDNSGQTDLKYCNFVQNGYNAPSGSSLMYAYRSVTFANCFFHGNVDDVKSTAYSLVLFIDCTIDVVPFTASYTLSNCAVHGTIVDFRIKDCTFLATLQFSCQKNLRQRSIMLIAICFILC